MPAFDFESLPNDSYQVAPVPRGRSRFRVRVQLVARGVKPYVWKVYDEEDGRSVRRSPDQFRTSAQAWEAGVEC